MILTIVAKKTIIILEQINTKINAREKMMRNIRRTVAVILCVALAFSLSACSCKHEWKEATCTEPKTCGKCGETEGEPSGHKWEEATVDHPKTCSVYYTFALYAATATVKKSYFKANFFHIPANSFRRKSLPKAV